MPHCQFLANILPASLPLGQSYLVIGIGISRSGQHLEVLSILYYLEVGNIQKLVYLELDISIQKYVTYIRKVLFCWYMMLKTKPSVLFVTIIQLIASNKITRSFQQPCANCTMLVHSNIVERNYLVMSPVRSVVVAPTTATTQLVLAKLERAATSKVQGEKIPSPSGFEPQVTPPHRLPLNQGNC